LHRSRRRRHFVERDDGALGLETILCDDTTSPRSIVRAALAAAPAITPRGRRPHDLRKTDQAVTVSFQHGSICGAAASYRLA
jgi:hypothetical protein